MKWSWSILLLSAAAIAQNELPDREGFVLKVERNPKQFYAQDVPAGPYFAMEKALQLYPDEKVYVEAELKADTIFALKTVRENLHPERTFEVEFCQTVKEHVARPTELFIKNPFSKKLIYSIVFYSTEDREWQTVAKIARAKWTSKEIWNREVVASLVLKDWRLE